MSCLTKFIALTIVSWSLVACWQLPGDFDTLPLERKIEAYRRRFERGGGRSLHAEKLIAAHGYQAAEAMAPYILRKKKGISEFVAINIVWDVQSRGCDLRGSNAETSLKKLMTVKSLRRDLSAAAEGALESIAMGRHSGALLEPLPPGVCRPKKG
jgi:hypothetical protein